MNFNNKNIIRQIGEIAAVLILMLGITTQAVDAITKLFVAITQMIEAIAPLIEIVLRFFGG